MCFRNRDKKGALSGVKEPALLVLKVILDSVSRILLFATWVFSSSRDVYTGKYWIGKH